MRWIELQVKHEATIAIHVGDVTGLRRLDTRIRVLPGIGGAGGGEDRVRNLLTGDGRQRPMTERHGIL